MERYDNITPDLNSTNYSRVNKNTSLYEDVKRSELSRVNNNTNVRIIEQNGKTIDLEKIRKYINEVNNEPRSKRSVLSIPKEEKTIESIVNTLTELTEVNSIKILIEGEENKKFNDGEVSFEKIFIREE